MRAFSFALLMATVLIAGVPEIALAAAEGASVNPPGWVGGLMSVLALGLALGTGIWIRNKRL